MNKKIFFILLLLVTLFFWKGIFLSILSYKIQKNYHTSFSSKGLALSGRSLHFYDVELKGGGYFVKVDEIEVLFTLFPFSTHTVVRKPLVFLQEGSLAPFFGKKRGGFLKSFEIKEGRFQILQGEALREAFFSFSSSNPFFKLHFSKESDSHLTFQWKEGLTWELHKMPGEELLALASLFTKDPLFPTKLGGTYDGTIQLAKGRLEGALQGKKMVFALQGWEGVIEEGNWEWNYEDNLVSCRVQLEKGEVNKKDFKVSRLSMQVAYNPEMGLKGYVSGVFPSAKLFHLEGKGFFESQVQDWLDVVLTVEGGGVFSCSLLDIRRDRMAIQLQSESLDVEMAAFLQSLWSPFPLHMTEGIISASARLLFQDKALALFSLQKLRGDNLSFQVPDTLSFHLPKIEGGAFWEKDQKLTSSCHIKVEGGSGTFYAPDTKKACFQHLQGNVDLAGGKFSKGQISCELQGRKTSLNLLGSLEECFLSLQVLGDLSVLDPFSLGQEEEQNANVNCKCYVKDNGWVFAGEGMIEKGKERVENWSFELAYPQQGWVEGEGELPRYPFLFPKESQCVSGKGKFKGRLQKGKWFFLATVDNVELKTPDWEARIPHIEGLHGSVEDKARVTFPFENITVYLPKKDLYFYEAKGRFTLVDQALTLDIQHTRAEELALAGEVVFHLDKERTHLGIVTKKIEGTIEGGRRFFSHFHKSFFTEIPMQGILQSFTNGFYLATTLGEMGPIQCGGTFYIKEGKIQFPHQSYLRDFQAAMQWDSERGCSFQDATAQLVWKEKNYPVELTELQMVKEDKWLFDLRLTKSYWDILRLKGSFVAEEKPGSPMLATFSFDDKLTELYTSPLHIDQLILKEFSEIVALQMHPEINLQVLNEIFDVSMTGIYQGIVTKDSFSFAGEKGEILGKFSPLQGEVRFKDFYGNFLEREDGFRIWNVRGDLSRWTPLQGKFSANGKVSFSKKGWRAEVEAELLDASFQGKAIENHNSLHCLLDSQNHLRIDGIYLFYKDLLLLFPKELSFLPIDEDTPIQGSLEKEDTIRIFIQKLPFNILGDTKEVQDLSIIYDTESIRLDGLLMGQIKMQLHMRLDDHPYGYCSFEIPGSGSFPLSIYWSSYPKFQIDHVEGACSGIEAYFDATSTQTLTGKMKVNFHEAKKLFPEPLYKFLDTYQIGSGFEWKGKLTMDPMQFEGIVIGKQLQCLGIQLKTLFARVSLSLNGAKLSDIKLSDSAGTLTIDSLQIYKEKETWKLKMPHLRIEEFRPSLLQKIGSSLPEIEPFLIRKLQLNDFTGSLGDIATFTGSGAMIFLNSFKREHTIFDIPSDVLGSIFGLDLELLIPVKGTMDIEVKDGKFIFSNLHNSFSENNRSTFFFVSGSAGLPYMDFYGNLNVNIRMKQYVLFKFTEQFVISITGNLLQPKYNLRKKRFFSIL